MRALIAAGALLLTCAAAKAHQSLAPRRLELRLWRDRAAVVLRHALDEVTSATLEERFDRDADGRLSEQEASSAASWMADRSCREIGLTSGGVRVDLKVTSAALSLEADGGDAGDAHAHVTVVLEGGFDPPCPCSLELRDARLGELDEIPLEVVRDDETGERSRSRAMLSRDSPSWTHVHAEDGAAFR